MKTIAFVGVRIGDHCHVSKIDREGRVRPLLRRSDLRNHAARFDWGSNSGGSSQLSLAILAECITDTETVLDWYQDFKVSMVRRLGSSWVMEVEEVTDWLLNQPTHLMEFVQLDRIIKGGAA